MAYLLHSPSSPRRGEAARPDAQHPLSERAGDAAAPRDPPLTFAVAAPPAQSRGKSRCCCVSASPKLPFILFFFLFFPKKGLKAKQACQKYRT